MSEEHGLPHGIGIPPGPIPHCVGTCRPMPKPGPGSPAWMNREAVRRPDCCSECQAGNIVTRADGTYYCVPCDEERRWK